MRITNEDVQPLEIDLVDDPESYLDWFSEKEKEIVEQGYTSQGPVFSIDTFRKWSFQRPDTLFENIAHEGFNLLASGLNSSMDIMIEEKSVPVEIRASESNQELISKVYRAALESDLNPTHYERKT